jgi:hypothetical protein
MEQITVAIEELHLVLVEDHPFHVIFRPELVIDEPARADVAQPGLNVPTLVALREVVQLDHPQQRVAQLDQIALPELRRC